MIRPGDRVLIATRNKGKTREFREAFAALGAAVTDLNEWRGPEIPPIAEDGATFADNARIKARAVAEAAGIAALADDSGLCVDALGGAPGVYSARYAGEGATDADNNAKLLRELARANASAEAADSGAGPRLLSPARFVCALVLYDPASGAEFSAEGVLEGYIVGAPSGGGGFGYDPLFWLPAFGRTLAELSVDEKNRISHRGQALERLLRLLRP